MIIRRIFHVYKDDFPLLSLNHSSFDGNGLKDLMTGLILELSDLTSLPGFVYITRHTNDKIPQDHLAPFLEKFRAFVNSLGRDKPYNIPTVWFVGHFEAHNLIGEVQSRLDQKNVKYFKDTVEYDSSQAMYQDYWDDTKDAQLFPKFLHQVTMIGIDLLSVPSSTRKLEQLECLEWLQYKNAVRLESDLKKMERYLSENSESYRKFISTGASERDEFWENFKKVKVTKGCLGSWPHFLFNVCGVSSRARICD